MPRSRKPQRPMGITPEWSAWMRDRSAQLTRSLARKGLPMTWGAGRERLKLPPPLPPDED